MSISLVVRPGVDSAFLVWRSDFIAGCRGFALKRKIRRAAASPASPQTVGQDGDSAIELVSSWVGFAGKPAPAPGTREPTTIWPIQKYLWSDFFVNAGDEVAYQVVAMMGSADALTEGEASGWTDEGTIGATTKGGISCAFNRGIVASQWLSRALPGADRAKALASIIATPGNPIRNFLSGPARTKLVDLLNAARQTGGHIYAALFEFDDPELIPIVQGLGQRAHVVLANGSVRHKGDDENAAARDNRICPIPAPSAGRS